MHIKGAVYELLCPACRHSPQSLDYFSGAGSDGRVRVVLMSGGVLGDIVLVVDRI